MTMNSVASEARTCRFHLNARATWPPGLKDTLRALMDEVNLEPVDVRRELIELIETTLCGAPVVAVAPVIAEFRQVAGVGAVLLAFT